MLTQLLLLATIAQGPAIAWPRPVPNPARLDVPQPTAPVEGKEHFIGTVDASLGGKETVWVVPANVRLDTRKQANGKSFYFTGPPGTYVLYEVAVDAAGKSMTAERSVTIKPDVPNPSPPGPGPQPPNPTPNPIPVPPTPVPVPPSPVPPGPGKYGVAPLVYSAAMLLPADAKIKCPAVAAAFRSLASAIAAGGIPLLKIAHETRTQLDTVYGTDPKVRAAMLAIETMAIAKLKPQLKLNAANIGESYGEVAAGFEAVR